MKKLGILRAISFSVAIISTLAMIGGVFMLPLGASAESGAIIIFGALFIIHGIYGLLFYWIWFARTARRYVIARVIEKENIFSAAEVAARVKKNRDSVNKDIRYCIKKGYLVGLEFNGNYLKKKENQNG